MKIIVTHTAPDLDAITSIWLIKKFLPGWANARFRFVPAGERIKNHESSLRPELRPRGIMNQESEPIEKIDGNEVIHVDTGLGALDHHQIQDTTVCAASLTLDFVSSVMEKEGIEIHEVKREALQRIVKVVIDIDHFKEIFWGDPTADHHEFSLIGVLEGLKLEKPDNDIFYIKFISQCLDALLHTFENRIWAEKEIRQNSIKFRTRWGKGIGFGTVNDTVLSLAQKMGYAIVVRKDPRKGYVRVKARPLRKSQISSIRPFGLAQGGQAQDKNLKSQIDIDLTPVYKKLKEMDPKATWFLHVSKKMLLNGTAKNPKMVPTKLSLSDIIKVLENV